MTIIVFVVAIQCDTVTERMEKRCRQYAESVFEIVEDPILLPGARPKKRDTCRISTQTTIVGGKRAEPQEFPHMAIIGYGKAFTYWQCGGSLISDQWVLSAAHCTAVVTKSPTGAVSHELAAYARVGDLDLYSTDDDAQPFTYKIIKRVRHPEYKRPQAYNDIVLFKLERTVQFSRMIRPICLLGLVSPNNNFVVASGWGATAFNGSGSSELLKVGLDVVTTARCDEDWKESVAKSDERNFKRGLPVGIKGETQICAWAPSKDTCQGDSGGPIQQVLTDPYCMYTIIGVTSIGSKCGGDIPSIYTRVSYYLPWIESHVWPQS
ncbi:hypothetical protein GE061_006656 [Apolygus lucorum]|uniref:Uncharacterized protein n=1 Tax=Apolygus lucorum TaxID=248454 RepID=A0A6A4ILQ6_APOLU|nr:hypothetical protein GE061_006656 [Apolygus lucorum]